jgi:hypothetical protein
MSYPIPVTNELEAVLTTCSDDELEGLVAEAWCHPHVSAQEARILDAVVRYELTLRQQEPLWRKAGRFCRRHREELVIARTLLALVAGGLTGVAIHDIWSNS